MERRFVLFLVLTMLVWTGFIALQTYLAPPKPRPGQQAAKKAVEKPKDGGQNEEPAVAGKTEPPQDAQPAKPQEPPRPPQPQAPHRLVTIGSLDPASGFALLVTADSRGAAIRRVELNSPKYKSVDDHGGHLGHLEWTSAAGGGVEVQLVGPGTPAALATAAGGVQGGLIAGDIIQQVDGQPVADAAWLEQYLEKKKRPGQSITLIVRRTDAVQPIEFTAKLIRRPQEVVKPETHEYPRPGGGVRLTGEDPLSLLMTLDNIGGRILKSDERELPGLPSLYSSDWKVEQQGPDFVEFSYTLDEAALEKIGKSGSLKIVKRFTVARAEKPGDEAYHLHLQVAIHNLADQPQAVGYRLHGPTGLPLEGWWYSTKLHPEMWAAAGARDVAAWQEGLRHRLLGCPRIVSDVKAALDNKKPPELPFLIGDLPAAFHYVGVDTQFFAAAILPQEAGSRQPIKFRSAAATVVEDVEAIPKSRLRTANVSFRLSTAEAQLPPGQSLRHDYRVFFGPKEPAVLAHYGLSPLIEYGWRIFAYPAILLLHVLNGLYWLTSLVGVANYGIAIVLLTAIVRTCMIPVSLKQARTAAKMQELAPEIQRIKEKYPDDMMKQHAAVQELYKKHNFNMFGGCLPVFIQLPIFIGLYRCLSVDIDLRDAALIPGIAWASNLAGPDMLFYWKNWLPGFLADETGWLGPYFNVFPIITVALFLVQQKMFTPPATDEQTRMQQQMMTYMTIFMGVLFYKVPAGLCLYFITSSLWGIVERKLLPKVSPQPGEGGSGAAAALSAKPASPNGSTRIAPGKRHKQKK